VIQRKLFKALLTPVQSLLFPGKNKMNSKTIIPLVVLLAVSFVVAGVLWTKLIKLENETDSSIKTDTRQLQSSDQRQDVLGVQDFAKITADTVSTKGDKNAPITIVEFSEYLCPFCAEYVGFDAIPNQPIDQQQIYQKIMKNYVETGKVRYIFRDYPIHGEPAVRKAEAARCAGDQNKFWEYHDLLFSKLREEIPQDQIEEKLTAYAQTLNLDTQKFSFCLSNRKYLQNVKDDYNLGTQAALAAWDAGLIDHQQVPNREQASFGTPSFLINGRLLIGAQPYEKFEKIIEEELKQLN